MTLSQVTTLNSSKKVAISINDYFQVTATVVVCSNRITRLYALLNIGQWNRIITLSLSTKLTWLADVRENVK